jgi:hypothetical protein
MEINQIVKDNIDKISKQTLNNFINVYGIEKSKITKITNLESEIFNLFMFDYSLHSNPEYIKSRSNFIFNIIDSLEVKYESFIKSNDLNQLIESRFNDYADMPQKEKDWKRLVNELLIMNLKGSLNNLFMKNYPIIPDGSFVTNPVMHIEQNLYFAQLQVNDGNEIIKIVKKLNGNEKKGCYVATMVYKDYNSKEVIVLREYRDNTLSKSILGRMFIKIYYTFSPSFVRLFENNKRVNSGIKSILDKLIEKLKRNR